MLGKKALQTGLQVAQDVLARENVKNATKKLWAYLPKILRSQVEVEKL